VSILAEKLRRGKYPFPLFPFAGRRFARPAGAIHYLAYLSLLNVSQFASGKSHSASARNFLLMRNFICKKTMLARLRMPPQTSPGRPREAPNTLYAYLEFFDEVRVYFCRTARCAGEGFAIDGDQAEFGPVAVGPFEVVEEGPVEVAADVCAFIDCFGEAGE